MRRTVTIIITLLMVFMLSSTSVFAAKVHFKGGPPDCELNSDNTVTCTGEIAGVGQETVTVLVTAVGYAEVICTNPGGNPAPGQLQRVNASGSDDIDPEKNGTLEFTVTSLPYVLPSGPATSLGCPNDSWSASLGEVTITGYTLQFFQGGDQVLDDEGTF